MLINTHQKNPLTTPLRGWSALALTLSLFACGGGGGSASNTAPEVMELAVVDLNGGHSLQGDELLAQYAYTDVDGDSEGDTRIAWLRNDQPIEGASGKNYALTELDNGHIIRFELTPVAAAGELTGQTVLSPPLPVGYRPGQLLPREDFLSVTTGQTYTVEVYLPGGYDHTDNYYPVMYQTDDLATKVTVLDATATKLILVSMIVSIDRRSENFYLPGAYGFYDFLTLELIPYIEAKYRIDPQQRTLMGFSYGGSFTAAAMLIDQPVNRYFQSYVISDGTFSNQAWKIINLEERLAELTSSIPATLIVCGATEGNLIGNEGFYGLFVTRDYADLQLHYCVHDAAHAEVFPLTFSLALDILYP
jgi:hypothetical protein